MKQETHARVNVDQYETGNTCLGKHIRDNDIAMCSLKEILSLRELERLFPEERTEQFFEALFGGTEDGAYTIRLRFKEHIDHELRFDFELIRRPGKCLVCSLTHGLPQVFSRHPVINLQGLYKEIVSLLDSHQVCCNGWRLGTTRTVNHDLHIIPFIITLTEAE
jgi:hypothetical protein